ncbi:MAG: aminodeoxychorismate/anthranilate synthase component II [Bacteroidota bacterium]|nr:MAG: aminodeoxychorismate/anthranilate synthase component II [Bacteroidota bacterium]
MKILVIDNYDSFTYNLVHYLENLTHQHVDVFRNDQISLDAVDNYDKILLSPGPGVPEEAGICLDLIRRFAPTKSILGVCLGHQAIGEAFGGTLINLDTVYHGVSTEIGVVAPEDRLYNKIPGTFEVGRYHSWVVDRESLPECLKITSLDNRGLIMGLSHKEYDVKGVQYHPESVLTQHGMQLLENWLAYPTN